MMHPRIRARLDETLARRLAAYEETRVAAWSSVAEVLRRLVRLNAALDADRLRELQGECLRVLHILDEFQGPALPHPDHMFALLDRVHGIAAMAEALSLEA